MPKAIPSPALAAYLVERNIALWDAYHYLTADSTTKNPTKRDPVAVELRIPENPDARFLGYGSTIDEAVYSAIYRSHWNRDLMLREGGIDAAISRLTDAVMDLGNACRMSVYRATHEFSPHDGLDDDVPF